MWLILNQYLAGQAVASKTFTMDNLEELDAGGFITCEADSIHAFAKVVDRLYLVLRLRPQEWNLVLAMQPSTQNTASMVIFMACCPSCCNEHASGILHKLLCMDSCAPEVLANALLYGVSHSNTCVNRHACYMCDCMLVSMLCAATMSGESHRGPASSPQQCNLHSSRAPALPAVTADANIRAHASAGSCCNSWSP